MEEYSVEKIIEMHYCQSRRRKDLWNRISSLANQIAGLREGNESARGIVTEIEHRITELAIVERYWAYPGKESVEVLKKLKEEESWKSLAEATMLIARMVSTDAYRDGRRLSSYTGAERIEQSLRRQGYELKKSRAVKNKPYFELLVIDSLELQAESQIREMHLRHLSEDDDFTYDVVVASSHAEAIAAVLINYNIQSCVIRYSVPRLTKRELSIARIHEVDRAQTLIGKDKKSTGEPCEELAKSLKRLRPELSCFLLCDITVEKITGRVHEYFDRCFFGTEDYLELRLSIIKSVYNRYQTPFFDALRAYSKRPSGVFHAMPISRGKSISKSHWISDYGDFNGERMFLSETSATLGGLDSLLKPKGSIREATEAAARAFQSKKTFFVTNGTSTANKIALQGLTTPGQIVLMSDDCHKSHHYAALLCGTTTIQLCSNRIKEHGIVGGISADEVKYKLGMCRDAGLLEKVSCIVLTNITFDGIASDLFSIVLESLAIKPDIAFIIDEAWFAYGNTTPMTRARTAMMVANRLREVLNSDNYRSKYRQWYKKNGPSSALTLKDLIDKKLLPDPDSAIIRIYSTQSTHKTLTALRQGSMIHINDDRWDSGVEQPFTEAYQCHTSTSPNYQILASLDIARRQIDLEGYELVQKAFELSMIVRAAVKECLTLSRHFRALDETDMIPMDRDSLKLHERRGSNRNWKEVEESWANGQFAIDPSRITLSIRRPDVMPGPRLRKILMEKYDIQVNKTSNTTILIIIHIGATRGMVTYLIESLREIATQISYDEERVTKRYGALATDLEREFSERKAIPTAAKFHRSFLEVGDIRLNAGVTRRAAELGRSEENVRYIVVDEELIKQVAEGYEIVSATMITPYPPGYPILLHGQIASQEVLEYLQDLQEEEVHGYDRECGLRVFKDSAL